MSETETDKDAPEFDPDDPRLTRFDLVREGARRDGVEIVHYQPRFTKPGSKEEKRVVRFVALCFFIVGLAALAFIVAYVAWPWRYEPGSNLNKFYTPVLGTTLGLALLFIGIGIITWAKKLLPEEVSVERRHDGASPDVERKLTAATAVSMVDELGIQRRPLLKGAVALGLAPVGVAAIMPLGGLIKDHKSDLLTTAWKKGVRLMHDDGTLVRPEDVSAGGQITVFPAIPGGNTNKYADSPTLLIHLRDADAERALSNALPINKGAQWNNYLAYSKICTHAGCPASLYEQQTNRLLCPCHQSQFDITNNARPIFGPATRRLPQLPITVDSDGYFVATSDYKVPIGPGFWERP
ncbi:Rieske 2Fe-2S domain-containing protein [Actinocatenispora sera]|uniref:Cytochrome bc1 complex Rieske iron-sulfur subunit n=1 Tax=Actinocatenispora sera TaxID=390989 RepID=A0A810L405_9ACTN|nr:Rieske 2Fe-2S domain-containing protein [Actinocatenispora sera]BCJ29136.1 ubiquinol-cytochrome c reductase iron-sulfur subunit [Actinocatenispora sera]